MICQKTSFSIIISISFVINSPNVVFVFSGFSLFSEFFSKCFCFACCYCRISTNGSSLRFHILLTNCLWQLYSFQGFSYLDHEIFFPITGWTNSMRISSQTYRLFSVFMFAFFITVNVMSPSASCFQRDYRMQFTSFDLAKNFLLMFYWCLRIRWRRTRHVSPEYDFPQIYGESFKWTLKNT